MKIFDFNEQFRMADAPEVRTNLEKALALKYKGSTLKRASNDDDIKGVDFWWTLPKTSGDVVKGIDVKVRSEDWKPKGEDDLCLELWSAMPTHERSGKIGCHRDSTKITDYLVWYWLDTQRTVIVPFAKLQKAFEKRWIIWAKTYRTAQQKNKYCNSQCVFVPRHVIAEAIIEDDLNL